MASAKLNIPKIKEAIRGGAIAAIPKRGESSSQAVARVQRKNPGKTVIDPPENVLAALQSENDQILKNKNYDNAQSVKEAHLRIKGYGAITKSCTELLVKPTPMCTLPDANLESTPSFMDIGPAPKNWAKTYGEVNHKYNKNVLDRTFNIFQVRKNKLEMMRTIGREWTPYFKARYKIVDGQTWGDVPIKVEPAFSGIMADMMSTSMVKALQSLPHAFAHTSASNFVPATRHAMYRLVNMPLNAVRLLTRFAVLFLTATIVEEEGDSLKVIGVQGSPEEMEVYDGASYNNLIYQADKQCGQVLYTELEKVADDPEILEIYKLAMTNTLHIERRGSDRDMPAIFDLWPKIDNPILAIFGPARAILGFGHLDSDTIWNAIELYVTQMGLSELWQTVFRSVATMTWRPSNGTNFCGHEAVRIAIPKSQLGPASLGPIIGNMRHWVDESFERMYPVLAEVAWEATSRYMLWNLLIRDYTSAMGGLELMHMDLDRTLIARMEWLVSAHGRMCPINKYVEIGAAEHGWQNFLGPMLCTILGLDKVSVRRKKGLKLLVPLQDEYAVQWEEVLDCTTSIPEGSAALSMIYPSAPNTIPSPRMWIKPSIVYNRASTVDAVYSMYMAGADKIALAFSNNVNGTVEVTEIKPISNYRGEIADCNILCSMLEDHTHVAPVCKFNTDYDALDFYTRARRLAEAEWYITRDYTMDDEGYMNLYASIDDDFPLYWEGIIEANRDESTSIEETREGFSEEDEPQTETKQAREFQEYHGVQEAEHERARPKTPMDKEMDPRELRINENIDQVKRVLGYVPEWMEHAKIVMLNDPSLTDRAKQTAGHKCREGMRNEDFLGYIAKAKKPDDILALSESVATMMENIGMFTLVPEEKVKLLREAQAMRNMGVSHQLQGGITDAESYSKIMHRRLPSHISPVAFNKALKLGANPGELVALSDAEEFQKHLDVLVRAEEERMLAADTASHSAAGEESLVVPLENGQSRDRSKTIESGAMETREEVRVIESDDPGSVGFGGGQPSQGDGGRDPTSAASGATRAEESSPQVETIAFTAPRAPGESSNG
jgi:hypothetical protein